MSTVYVVTAGEYGEYSDYGIIGIFSTEDLAREYLERHRNPDSPRYLKFLPDDPDPGEYVVWIEPYSVDVLTDPNKNYLDEKRRRIAFK